MVVDRFGTAFNVVGLHIWETMIVLFIVNKIIKKSSIFIDKIYIS
jgi:hypothetical protein